MENSCRKKYKPSPKKWILASRRTGFRRNSALIPANAGLFHYAGNNPVRYIDPDGRMYKNPFEKEFVCQVLGSKGVNAYEHSWKFSISDKYRSGSLIFGFVFYESDVYDNPMEKGKNVNTFIHELFHQVQYGSDIGAFPELILEYCLNKDKAEYGSIIGIETCYDFNGSSYIKYVYDSKPVDNYTYQYESWNLSKYNTLSDLPFLESQAQFVGDYAELYFEARFGNGIGTYTQYKLKQMARIMKNSGYEDTEAVRWIENDIK